MCEGFALKKGRYDIVILDQGEKSYGVGMPLDKRITAYVNEKMPACLVMGIFGKTGYVFCLPGARVKGGHFWILELNFVEPFA